MNIMWTLQLICSVCSVLLIALMGISLLLTGVWVCVCFPTLNYIWMISICPTKRKAHICDTWTASTQTRRFQQMIRFIHNFQWTEWCVRLERASWRLISHLCRSHVVGDVDIVASAVRDRLVWRGVWFNTCSCATKWGQRAGLACLQRQRPCGLHTLTSPSPVSAPPTPFLVHLEKFQRPPRPIAHITSTPDATWQMNVRRACQRCIGLIWENK